jgi:hypothetical protein
MFCKSLNIEDLRELVPTTALPLAIFPSRAYPSVTGQEYSMMTKKIKKNTQDRTVPCYYPHTHVSFHHRTREWYDNSHRPLSPHAAPPPPPRPPPPPPGRQDRTRGVSIWAAAKDRPSCPRVFRPTVHTIPASVRSTVCPPPAHKAMAPRLLSPCMCMWMDGWMYVRVYNVYMTYI